MRKDHVGFQELPGELPYSELHFFSRFHELQQQGVAQTFAWLTGKKVIVGVRLFPLTPIY